MQHQKPMKRYQSSLEICTTASKITNILVTTYCLFFQLKISNGANCQKKPKEKKGERRNVTWIRMEIFPCLFEGPPLTSNGHELRAIISNSFCSSSRTTIFSNSEEWATISITYSRNKVVSGISIYKMKWKLRHQHI